MRRSKAVFFFFSNPVARMNVSTTFCFVLFSACGLHTADNGSWKGKKKRRTLAYPRTIVGHLCDVLQNSRLHSAAALLQKKRGPKKRGGETMERRMRIAYTHTHTRTQEESRNKRERESPSIDRRASLYASHAIRFWVGGGVREGRMKTWGTKKRDIVLKRKVATYNLSQTATSIFRYKYQVFLISSALDRAYGVISIDCLFLGGGWDCTNLPEAGEN